MGHSLLIRNAEAILTGLPGEAARAKGPDVRVIDGRIAAIGALTPEANERVLDASGCAIYPAWVNTHHHLFQTLLKAVPGGIDVPLDSWLVAVPYAFRMKFDASLLQTAAALGTAELLLSGCTTMADHHYLYWPGMPFDGSAILFETAQRFGMRFVLCRGGATLPRKVGDGTLDPMPPERFDAIVKDLERLAKTYHDPGPESRRRVVAAPATPMWSMRPEEIREFGQIGRALGLRLHTHVSETRDYVDYCRQAHGCLPVEFMARLDWLGQDVWFAHLVHLDEQEMRMLADTRTGMAHCPGSNCRLGSGIAPAPALDRLGVPVSIGVDGTASNEPGDFVAEAHLAWYVHRARGGADAATIEDIVRWGTNGGAAVLGFEQLGAIAQGFLADVAVYELDDIRFAGMHDRGTAPVTTGVRPALRWLLSGGRIVVERGKIPGVDLESLARDARAAVARLAGG